MAKATPDTPAETELPSMPAIPAQATTEEKPKVAKAMRPVFSEIARLSATLGIARQACYAGDAAKAANALSLLSRQLPLAQETADLLVPSEAPAAG